MQYVSIAHQSKHMENVLKFRTGFSFLLITKALISKCLSEKQTGRTLSHFNLKKQPCLSRHFDRQLEFEILDHMYLCTYYDKNDILVKLSQNNTNNSRLTFWKSGKNKHLI